ncbi:hypothetical protein QFZ34_002060 [Phyllobacterium ifriqiyense]|uniref:HNH endonuclease n=1 Tax=Phyllobacterium ifriqiyense TaxID=314238 RepID=A0ABU0SAX5_9HYPH|nr:hypothetical protein [Phyllobacterium ifriqiyense]
MANSIFTCCVCTKQYPRISPRQKYCTSCRIGIVKEQARSGYARKVGYEVRSAGKEGTCIDCNKSFVRTGGRNQRCGVCLDKYQRDWRSRFNTRYLAEVPLGQTISCTTCGIAIKKSSGTKRFCIECRCAHDAEMARKRAKSYTSRHSARLAKAKAEKRKTDPAYAISNRVSHQMRMALKARKSGRRWESLVGYSLNDLMRHLERQFIRGMSWENRGEWHIDHILPLASFDFSTPECHAFKAAWALTNLRPLWSGENVSKGAKRLFLI